MKQRDPFMEFILAAIATAGVCFFVILPAIATFAAPKPLSPAYEERHDPLKGLVFYQHPFTKKLALYVAFELEPNRLYRFDVTDDGVAWETIEVLSTRGNTNDIYESFNVPDPCQGIWPRVVDLGPSL